MMKELNSVQFLFGAPFYKTKIDKDAYNKSNVIDTISENYKIDPNRNKWDLKSNLHHSYGDEKNSCFKQVDKKIMISLRKLYKESIENFFNSYLNTSAEYHFNIVNYTCMSSDQFMVDHIHPGCDFSAVHYLKFNSTVHNPTCYVNPSNWSQYLNLVFSEGWRKSVNYNSTSHSWMCEHFSLDIEEDDFVITPSMLRHYVPPSKSEELRMTIVLNIKFV